ncbi:MAG TPA: VWA domain-containing protein [Pyrinomonadaceae bacterium]|nr:VWA domain-containing protein [Pyrinomonadaceae bacterium]
MKTRSLLSFILANTLFITVAAQEPSPSPKPAQNPEDVVRITTNLVQIDAAVTDKKGKAVTDLKVEDFEVYEDGRPQKITNFSFVSVGSSTPSAAASPASAAARRQSEPVAPVPTVRLRADQVQRTVALVVDDLGLSFESMHFVRGALSKFVDEQMQPGDLVAIIRTGAGVGALQQFTSDKRLLHAAIDRVKWNSRGRAGIAAFAPIEDSPLDAFNKRPRDGGTEMVPAPINPGMKMDPEKYARDRYNDFKDDVFSVGTLGALNYIIRGLRTLPGRKSVVLLSDTMAIFDSNGEGNLRTIQALRRLTDLANRASVVIYTIDPRGLPALNLTAADNTSALATLGDGAYVRANSGPALMQTLNQRTLDLWQSQEGLKYLALETGGFFVSNNNDVSAGIKKALDASKNYYLIGYRPGESTFDPQTGRRRYHEISVRVKQPGLIVRTRTGFFGISNEEAQTVRRTVQEQLMAAITTPFASGDIDLRLTSVFLNEPEYGSFMRSLIFVNARSLTFQEQPDGSYHASVDVLAMTFDDGGIPVDRRSRTQEIIVPHAEYRAALDRGLTFGINLPVKTPGAFQLRIAVRDAGSGHVGSANQYVEVPNVKKDRLALSGIYLAERDEAHNILTTTNTGRVATNREDKAGEGQIAERDPQSGPAVRRFRSGAVVDYGFEIYNARLDKNTHLPQLQSQVRLFRDNQLVFSGKVLDLKGQVDSRRLVALGRLPLGANLSPGDYVLQVVVTDALARDKNRFATQWIDFEIR